MAVLVHGGFLPYSDDKVILSRKTIVATQFAASAPRRQGCGLPATHPLLPPFPTKRPASFLSRQNGFSNDDAMTL